MLVKIRHISKIQMNDQKKPTDKLVIHEKNIKEIFVVEKNMDSKSTEYGSVKVIERLNGKKLFDRLNKISEPGNEKELEKFNEQTKKKIITSFEEDAKQIVPFHRSFLALNDLIVLDNHFNNVFEGFEFNNKGIDTKRIENFYVYLFDQTFVKYKNFRDDDCKDKKLFQDIEDKIYILKIFKTAMRSLGTDADEYLKKLYNQERYPLLVCLDYISKFWKPNTVTSEFIEKAMNFCKKYVTENLQKDKKIEDVFDDLVQKFYTWIIENWEP